MTIFFAFLYPSGHNVLLDQEEFFKTIFTVNADSILQICIGKENQLFLHFILLPHSFKYLTRRKHLLPGR